MESGTRKRDKGERKISKKKKRYKKHKSPGKAAAQRTADIDCRLRRDSTNRVDSSPPDSLSPLYYRSQRGGVELIAPRLRDSTGALTTTTESGCELDADLVKRACKYNLRTRTLMALNLSDLAKTPPT